jgi:hypothetical protein
MLPGSRTPGFGFRTIVAPLVCFSLLALSTNASSQLADAGAEAGLADAGGVDGQSARKALERAILLLAENPPDRDRARSLFESALLASDKQVVAEAHARLGSLDEEDGAYARAFDQYQACVALSPTGRLGRNIRMRVEWLKARSEGDFAPLSRLWAMRRDPAFTHDPAVALAFVREANGFPPGIVRSEATMAAAEALLAMHRVDEATPLFVEVRDDPRSLPMTVKLAEGHVVQARIEAGDVNGAADEVDRRGALVTPEQIAAVRRLERRRTLRRTALAGLGVYLAFAGMTVAWAGRRRDRAVFADVWRALGGSSRRAAWSAMAVTAGAYGILAAVLLAFRHDPVRAAPCLAAATLVIPFAIGTIAVDAASAKGTPRRVLLVALGIVGVASASYLALNAFLPVYLDRVGL